MPPGYAKTVKTAAAQKEWNAAVMKDMNAVAVSGTNVKDPIRGSVWNDAKKSVRGSVWNAVKERNSVEKWNSVEEWNVAKGDVINMTDQNQAKLLRFIYEVGFAIDDVVLYLDTHPCDIQALEYYENYKKLYRQAVDEYTQFYGPLSNENVYTSNSNYWAWASTPWPWEGACR